MDKEETKFCEKCDKQMVLRVQILASGRRRRMWECDYCDHSEEKFPSLLAVVPRASSGPIDVYGGK